MDRDKLKVLIRNLKDLVQELESEIFSDTDSYMYSEEGSVGITDYDEVFDDDDGYCD